MKKQTAATSLNLYYSGKSTTFNQKWLMEYNVKHDREQNYKHLQCVSCLFLTRTRCRQSMLAVEWDWNPILFFMRLGIRCLDVDFWNKNINAIRRTKRWIKCFEIDRCLRRKKNKNARLLFSVSGNSVLISVWFCIGLRLIWSKRLLSPMKSIYKLTRKYLFFFIA